MATKAKKKQEKKAVKLKRDAALTGSRVCGGRSLPRGACLGMETVVSPFADALMALDDAHSKVVNIRKVLLGNEGDGFEIVANRARRLSDAVAVLQQAAWTLRDYAYAEADK